jgi:sensor histidine kinase YesM
VLKHRQQKLREAEIRGSIASLRMEGVRNRITPHFIYNALASEMLAQMEGKKVDLEPLVQLLHRGIELTDIDQSSLSEELKFIQFYCKIESRSVGDDFEYEVRLSDGIDAERVMLPSMSVQILVENAIKHGLKARKPQADKPRKVTVTARKQGDATLIEVIDNGVGLPNGRKLRERTGLRVMQQTIYLLNEKHQQSASYHHGDTLMDYGMDNYTHADGQTGCRAWLLLPDHFDYTLR